MMHEKSMCIIIAPKRGVTMDQFLGKVTETKAFKYEISESITEEVDKLIEGIKTHKLYREIEHKPYLIKMWLI